MGDHTPPIALIKMLQTSLSRRGGLGQPTRISYHVTARPARIPWLHCNATQSGQGSEELPEVIDRERLLFMELIATRKQVDRLLDQQQSLISLVVASHPSFVGGQSPAMPMLPPSSVAGVLPPAAPAAQLPGQAPPAQQLPAAPQPTPAAQQQYAQPQAQVQAPQYVAPIAEVPGAAILGAIQAVDGPAQQQVDTWRAPEVQLPTLKQGDHSSWWMEKLHVALLASGYYSGDDDVQSWAFGSGTQQAILDFQTDKRLATSGVADAPTWAALMAVVPDLHNDILQAVASGSAPPAPGTNAATRPASMASPIPVRAGTPTPVSQKSPIPARAVPTASRTAPTPARGPSPSAPAPAPTPAQSGPTPVPQVSPTTALFSSPTPPKVQSGGSFNPSFAAVYDEPEEEVVTPEDLINSRNPPRSPGDPEPKEAKDGRPPILSRGDKGGFFMETLHAALLRAGYDPSFRDADFVEFGRGTDEAVRSFQQARNLPITGLVDEVMWALLLQSEPDLRSAFVNAVALGLNGSIPAVDSSSNGDGNGNGNSAPAAATPEAAAAPAAPATTAAGAAPTAAAVETKAASTNGSAAATATATPVAASATPAAAKADLESEKEPVNGLPPQMCMGDDNIAWMSRLHGALVARGFYPSEEECEEWLFGESTHEAVMYAQAAARLPETGLVDASTWGYLLDCEESAEVRAQVDKACGGDVLAAIRASPNPAAPARRPGSISAPASASDRSEDEGSDDNVPGAHGWPVLVEGDGGKEVRLLQLALGAGGYHCGEDECQWWQFGDGTVNALKTYQACAGLPESGVCDTRTWKKLLNKPDATPADLAGFEAKLLAELASDDESTDDMTTSQGEGKVWLLGEQRWEKKRD